MSHRGPEYAREPEWESQRAREGQEEIQSEPERASESLREQVRAKKEASLTFLAYLNIVLLQNN